MESPQNHFMITAQVEKRREKAGRPVHGGESARGPNAGLTQPNAETRGAGTSRAGKGGGGTEDSTNLGKRILAYMSVPHSLK